MNVIEHIRADGKTVVGVCRAAGISRQTFYTAIRPGSSPHMDTLRAIANATGLTPVQIKPELGE